MSFDLVTIFRHYAGMSEMHPSLVELDRAAALLGSRVKLSEAIQIKRTTLQSWFDSNRPVPAEACAEVERVTDGQVTRSDLRPDLWRPGETLQPLPPAPPPTLNDIALELADTAEENQRVLNGGRG